MSTENSNENLHFGGHEPRIINPDIVPPNEKIIPINEKEEIEIVEEKKEHPFWELLRFAILAFLIILPIRTFIAQPFIVSGSSMYPTFKDGNYLIVDQVSYKLEEPKRGEVIVFKYPKDTKKYFIKRIIGLPGETISIEGSTVTIKNESYPDGFELTEEYVKNLATNNIEVILGNDEYFVMGDNRSASSDSRSWGNVKKKLIIGRALVRILPFNETGFWPGEHKFEN